MWMNTLMNTWMHIWMNTWMIDMSNAMKELLGTKLAAVFAGSLYIDVADLGAMLVLCSQYLKSSPVWTLVWYQVVSLAYSASASDVNVGTVRINHTEGNPARAEWQKQRLSCARTGVLTSLGVRPM